MNAARTWRTAGLALAVALGLVQSASTQSPPPPNGITIVGFAGTTFGVPAVSADGRHVAFISSLPLDPTDLSIDFDIYVTDRQLGTTVRVSRTDTGISANNRSERPSISADGRFIAFDSAADNLVPGDTNTTNDIFVHDRDADGNGIFDEPGGTSVTRVSVSSNGTESNCGSFRASISGNGRYVAFDSCATNWPEVQGKVQQLQDIFVHDRQTGTTLWASPPVQNSTNGFNNHHSGKASISFDGRTVAFGSQATTQPTPTFLNTFGTVSSFFGSSQIFVRDTQAGTTVWASPQVVQFVNHIGQPTDAFEPSISADGRYVTYEADAVSLVSGDKNEKRDIFVFDRQTQNIARVSVSSSGAEATTTGGSVSTGSFHPTISGAGRFVTFESNANSLVADDNLPFNFTDAFLHDRDTDGNGIFDEPGGISTLLISRNPAGAPADSLATFPGVSSDGHVVAFNSFSRDIHPNASPITVLAWSKTNQAPVANGGADQSMSRLSAALGVTLDGAASHDPDGDALTFTWSTPFGNLTGPASSVVLFLAVGTHTITLTVDDGHGGSAVDTVTVTITDTADLSITASASPDPVNAGSDLTLALTATNSGPAGATNVGVTTALPAGVNFVSASTSQGSCAAPPVGSSGTISCNLGTLAAAANATLSFVTKAAAAGPIALVSNISATEADANTTNNSVTTSVTAQPAPPPPPTSGPQFRVNTSTFFNQFNATMGMNANGASVIAWVTQANPDRLLAQRFRADGAPDGLEFRVDNPAVTGGRQSRHLSAAMDKAGNFVIVWSGGAFIQSGGSWFCDINVSCAIFAQRYDANGNPLGTNLNVNGNNPFGFGPADQSSVAMYPTGEFVVAWNSFGDGGHYGVFAQRFDANGTPVGAGFPVNSFTSGPQFRPAVAVNPVEPACPSLPCGFTLPDFVIVWEGAGSDDNVGIFAQRFASNGSPQGSQFRVNTTTIGLQEKSAVGMDEHGNFVAVWEGEGSGGIRGIFGQRFGVGSGPCPSGSCAATFGPLGSEFQVHTTTINARQASVGVSRAGSFVVAWDGVESSTSVHVSIFARSFDANGAALGDQFKLTDPFDSYFRPAARMDAAGNFVVAFDGGFDGSQGGIFARRFAVPTPPVSVSISIDDVSVTEGNSGVTGATFTVTLFAPAATTVTVDFATADGAATTADNDYAAAGGTLTFAPGETVKTITVNVTGDTTFEPDENFLVDLTNPSGATFAKAQGVGTIQNDDSNTVTINIQETILVTDSPGVLPSAMLNVSEAITVTDTPGVLPSAMLSVNENIVVTDTPVPQPSAMLNINENITVTDTPQVVPPISNAPPLVNAGTDQVIEATSSSGEQVSLSATASDPDGDSLSFSWAAAAFGVLTGANISPVLPIGVHTVTLTVNDGNGHAVSDTVLITIQDTTGPTLILPASISAVATSGAGAVVNFTPSAADLVGGALAANCAPASGSVFPVGTTTVNCTASDASGNSASGTFTVTVTLGAPRISGSIVAKGRDANGNYFVDLKLANTGSGHARNVQITTLSARTLNGTGAVTINAALTGALPLPVGAVDAGTFVTVRIFLNVPTTVTRFSITEGGSLQDVSGTNQNFSFGQSVIP